MSVELALCEMQTNVGPEREVVLLGARTGAHFVWVEPESHTNLKDDPHLVSD